MTYDQLASRYCFFFRSVSYLPSSHSAHRQIQSKWNVHVSSQTIYICFVSNSRKKKSRILHTILTGWFTYGFAAYVVIVHFDIDLE